MGEMHFKMVVLSEHRKSRENGKRHFSGRENYVLLSVNSGKLFPVS